MMMLLVGLAVVSMSFGVVQSFTLSSRAAPSAWPSGTSSLRPQCTATWTPRRSKSSSSTTKSLIALPPSSCRLFSTTKESSSGSALNEKQLDFILGYLNKHHQDLLTAFAETFSTIGIEKAKKNAWSGGSFKIESARIVGIDTTAMELDVSVVERNGVSRHERVMVELGKQRTISDQSRCPR